ncbi:malonate transporter subunit MadL [Pseudomonas syringae group genomosp. 3]|uniref:malonate transporter subunit MadL n=1 Tax=Pseudomonas syringae group genomosp. 3 TaxID=251701 RepID=UPI0006E63736|nr:malonate transporter subunit MadL [Pseudomonas syringae group genomosp. 3]KPW49130.1 Malonate transporter, MadL subunit [Pseudomonas syringae pv. berberidis]KPY28848.1 Malonate transporter, MadL subunit [Pseudomonas syringae pv. philadelphi]RMM15762.1 Malonate transporter, MadL subunit [Pseudomonas syringae pv. berberidis]RMP60980.1 Malonate transporter, MadL subunit [Pseudomonas syringae pv. berberidis]RMQ37458.1 Malonate transporter, MadL subunit [Pseudomonas syringae pv. berberidis]
MIIYGVALLAICTLAGVILGDMLGVLLGVKSNVGGVGIAMILLICARLWMEKNGGMSKDCEMGVGFWGGAVYPGGGRDGCATECRKGGPVAVLAAVGSVVLCACTIAVISRTNRGEPLPREEPLLSPVIPEITPAGGR